MRRKDKIIDLKKMYKSLENKRDGFLYHKFTKYVVDYTIEEDRIKVISNIGRYKYVKNTRPNMSKLNQTIVKNKIDIANKIDDYERTSTERLAVFLINISFLIISGMLVPLSFFMGSYIFFLLGIIVFSVCVLTTSIIGMNIYVQVKEIQNLKDITGYKKETEFKLPHIDVNAIKSR